MRRRFEFDDEYAVRVYGSRKDAEKFVYTLTCFHNAVGCVKRRISEADDWKDPRKGTKELLLLVIEFDKKDLVKELAENCNMELIEGWF